MQSSRVPRMKEIHVTTPGVQKLLSNLNISKAAGPDGISAKILNELACEISHILAHIFNQSLHTGDILSDWLDANIVLLFKKVIC